MAQAANDNITSADEKKHSDEKASGPEIQGRFARYLTAFGQLILPFLSVRYLFEGLDNIFDLNHTIRHWHNPVPVQPRPNELLFGRIPNEGIARWVTSNILTLSFGTAISGVMAYYTGRTYQDVKNLYREALSYELGKNPGDISFRDMAASQNKVVQATKDSLIKRSIVRFSSAFAFFLPWGLINSKKYANTDQLDNVGFRLGTGAVGTYLFSDGFLRTESFFEALQLLVDTKINHDNGDPFDVITAKDIEHMVQIQRGWHNKSYKPPVPASQEAQRTVELCARIADSMNQTYGNTSQVSDINFTTGKFVYLFGNGFLEKYPESLAYVNLAGKSSDMKAVNTVADAIRKGASPQAAFAQYGIQLCTSAETQKPQEPQQDEQPTTKYTEMVLNRSASRIPITARTPQEFAAIQENGPPSVGQ